MDYVSSRREFLTAASFAYPASRLAASLSVPAGLRYNTLGRTGLKVTKFGVGSANDPAVLYAALERGINFFFSARDYGNGNRERQLGEALRGRRQKIVLATATIDLTLANRPPQSAETTQFLMDQLDESLKALRTDCLDLWLFHNKSNPEYISDDLLNAARRAKKEGKTRFAGFSTHSLPVMADLLVKSELLDVVMTIYNFTMDDSMHAAVEKVHKAGVGVIAIKTSAGGGRRSDISTNPVFQRPGAIPACIRWAMNQPGVDCTVTGVRSMDQLDENISQMSAPFTKEDQRLLSAYLDWISPVYCRNCRRCDGACRQGLPVPDILRYLMYAEDYGDYHFGFEKFLALPDEVKNVRCARCPGCTVQCYYGIRVPERLARAQELFVTGNAG